VLVGVPDGGYPFGSVPVAMGFIKPACGWTNMTAPTNVIQDPEPDLPLAFGWAVAIGESALVVGAPSSGGDFRYYNYVYVYGRM
jgi:hypothetical protein